MNENILFLILVPLLFLGMITALIYVIIKNIKTKKGLKAFADRNAWKFYSNINDDTDALVLNDILNSTINKFYKSNKISVSNIVKGNYQSMDFWFAFYKSSNKSGISKNRTSSEFNIFIVPEENIKEELIVLYRTKMLKMLPIEKLSNLIGKPLFIPEKEGIDWLLVSNLDAFKNLNIDFADYKTLQDNISKAHSILFYKGYFIYAIQWNTTISTSKFESFLPRVKEIRNLLNKQNILHIRRA